MIASTYLIATPQFEQMSSPPQPPPGHFALLYFASANSYTSKEADYFEAPLSLPALFDLLEQKYAGIKKKILDSCLVTINLEYVELPGSVKDTTSEIVIKAGDEVAIIPPVSSG